jgi:tRNA 2-thiouridine synthesizing protein B
VLHLIFQSPIETAVLKRIDSGDVAVFLENSVLRILQDSDISDTLTQSLNNNRLYVLSDDLVARGIALDQLVKGFEVIDYPGLVELAVNSPVIQSWT